MSLAGAMVTLMSSLHLLTQFITLQTASSLTLNSRLRVTLRRSDKGAYLVLICAPYMPHKNAIGETGKRYGRLVVLRESGTYSRRNKLEWLCLCDCGNELAVEGQRLRNRNVRSCGCLRKDTMLERWKTHGLHEGLPNKHPLHNIWTAMKARCYVSTRKSCVARVMVCRARGV